MTLYRGFVKHAAARHDLDPDVVEAMVLVESGGNPYAYNPEPKYRYFWDVRAGRPFRKVSEAELAAKFPPKDFRALAGDPDQEWWAQQASWGLMQVMGAVAREYGCRLPFLTELTRPDLCVDIGCSHLALLLRRAGGNLHAALAMYNGGPAGNARPPYRNAAYVQKVLEALARVQQ